MVQKNVRLCPKPHNPVQVTVYNKNESVRHVMAGVIVPLIPNNGQLETPGAWRKTGGRWKRRKLGNKTQFLRLFFFFCFLFGSYGFRSRCGAVRWG
jgi:hypothetical protein